MHETAIPTIRLDATGISVAGRREILLCSSLFYFRLPEGSWEDRMEKIRLAGYNCLDVYFPWNFHEVEKNVWDFSSGMRDVDRFLALAENHELYVMARPGPYICSEWDGGGLPSYLFAEALAIRQNDHAYLARVGEWYRRILPIIAKHQYDRGGSVVLLQVENELDFFRCRDVPGYIGALAACAREQAITVPLIACSGQNDLYAAWGGVDDVAPSMNLYLPSQEPGLEHAVSGFSRTLGELDVPLMVPEMGRDNLLMRRYLAAGAKLLGPYNQVAGFDFGFTTGINNWGDPVSFQTAFYDFVSLVTPYGEIRPFIADDRVFSGLLRSMGGLLAGALPVHSPGGSSGYTLRGPAGELDPPPVLSLAGGEGAEVVAVTNLTGAASQLVLSGRGFSVPVELPELGSAFVLVNVDLSSVGVPILIRVSTAEPYLVDAGESPTVVWQAPVSGSVEMTVNGKDLVFAFECGRETRTQVALSDDRTLTMIGVGREQAATVSGVADGRLVFLEHDLPTDPLEPTPTGTSKLAGIRTGFACSVAHTNNADLFAAARKRVPAQTALRLEQNGIHRGYGLYTVEGSVVDPVAVVLHDASDVASLYRDGVYAGTVYPGGCHAVIELRDETGRHPCGSPAPASGADASYAIRTEIWGHSNFDDSRKPSLRIGSLRGIGGLTEVREVRPIRWWRTESPAGGTLAYYAGLGGRLTTDRPTASVWHASFVMSRDDDGALLRFDGIACEGEVTVNDRSAGRVDAFAPIVDISEYVRSGEEACIAVRLTKRHFAEPAGAVSALLGRRATGWRLAGAEEETLLASARRATRSAVPAELPLTFPAGGLAWVYLDPDSSRPFGDHKLAVSGANCKVTVLFNGTACGRLVLPSEGGPVMRTAATLGYLPGCWAREEANELTLLVEAVGPDDAMLDEVELIEV